MILLEVWEESSLKQIEDSYPVHRPINHKNQKVNSTYDEETKIAFVHSEYSVPNLAE